MRALFLLAALAAAATTPAAELRQAYGDGSPAWLRAVARLQVPGVRYRDGYASHSRENCSATLVAATHAVRADTLVTAWHCLEDYRDLSQPILVTLLTGDGEHITREAYRVADGGGMYADWAVLKLLRPLARDKVIALGVYPGLADRALPVTMAGYSGDPGLGAGGQRLTYHADCHITGQAGGETESDCSAFRGASGGAVVQLGATGEALLCGVISRGDGEGISTYVPVQGFRGVLKRHLTAD